MQAPSLIRVWLPKLEHLDSRYLVTDTQKYFMILSASYHPNVLMSPLSREALYEKIWPISDTIHEYLNVYNSLKNQLFTYTDMVSDHIHHTESARTGIFNGESSIVAVYLLIYQLTRGSLYLEKAKQHAVIVRDLVSEDSNNDLLDGKTDAILVFSELYTIDSG